MAFLLNAIFFCRYAKNKKSCTVDAAFLLPLGNSTKPVRSGISDTVWWAHARVWGDRMPVFAM